MIRGARDGISPLNSKAILGVIPSWVIPDEYRYLTSLTRHVAHI